MLRCHVIVNFKHKGLKRLYENADRSKIRPDLVEKADRFLTALNSANSIQDVDLPGYQLHPLTGDLKGFWSVFLSRNHRIVFRFYKGTAHDIDLIDYH